MDIGCLDLGSNSFHLQLFSVVNGCVQASLLDEKRAVRLGDSVFRDGAIDESTWRAGLEAFGELLVRARQQPLDRFCAVATSALRRADNGLQFLRALERRYGVTAELLSPDEEATIAYDGARSSGVFDPQARTAVIDVGGGSAEITVGRAEHVLFSDSLPLGVLRMRHAVEALPAAERTHEGLIASIGARYGTRLRQAGALRPTRTVFASGTARAVRKLAMGSSEQPGKTGPLTLQALQSSLERHRGSSGDELLALGVEAARVDTILTAHAVLIALMSGLGTDQGLVVDGGLRQGLALREERSARLPSRSGAAPHFSTPLYDYSLAAT